MRHIRVPSTWNRHYIFFIIFVPVRIGVLTVSRSIYGGDQIPQPGIVSALVKVEGALLIFGCRFVHDVHHNSSVGDHCCVTRWNRFTKCGDIPVEL